MDKKEKLNDVEMAAFKNACDCLCYGYGKKHWNSCGLDEERAKEIWRMAFYKMAEEE